MDELTRTMAASASGVPVAIKAALAACGWPGDKLS